METDTPPEETPEAREEVVDVEEATPKVQRRRGRMARTSKPASAPVRGAIGETIYEQVNALTTAEGVTRQAAFQRLSEETGRAPGTVAANYYRVLRREGGGRPRTAPTTSPPRGRRSRASSDPTAALKSALDDLAMVIRDQERELTRLRDENAQLEQIRSVLHGRGAGGRRRG